MNTSNQQSRPQPTPLCASFAPLLPLLRSGELPADDARETQAHLETCAWCQRQIATYDTVDTALRRHYGPADALLSVNSANHASHRRPQRQASTLFLSMEDIMREAETLPPASTNAPQATTLHPRPPHRPRASLLATVAAALIVALLGGLFAWRGPLASLIGGHGHAEATVTTPTAPNGTQTPTSGQPKPNAIYVGTIGGAVYSVAPDGTTRWHTSVGGAGVLALAADTSVNTIYAGVQTFTNSGVLYALRASDGHTLWTKTSFTPVALQAARGVVYAGAMESEFVALRASDGAQLWSYTQGGCSMGQFTLTDNVIYLNTQCGPIVALDATNGHVIWNVMNAALGTPVVSGDVVYIGGLALRASDGKQLWRFAPHVEGPASPSAVRDGRVYITIGQALYALKSSNGALIWSTPIASPNFSLSAPALGQHAVYVLQSQTLNAFDLTTGHLLWSTPVNTYASANRIAPPVADNVVYVGSSEGVLDAFSAQTGAVIWRVQTYNSIDVAPIVTYP